MLAAGYSLRAIGQALHRAPSTLSRELARQGTPPTRFANCCARILNPPRHLFVQLLRT